MTVFRKTLARATLAVAGVALAGAAMAADITGAGATFPYPIYSKWADAYKKETGIGLNYQSIGSGGGIKQIKAKTVTFGATDKPLKAEDLDEMGAIQWPMVMGGVVPVINVKGIAPGQLVLDGKTLADIFQGRISKWNDAAIAKLNPGVALPAKAIAVVHRADGSGTTFNFTYYLGQVSESWRVNVGVEQSVEWPVGIGGKGNEGVANMVTQTDGSIGYVEYAYAKQNKMTHTKMINKDGKTVAPDADTFAAAAANADWAKAKGFYLILANQPGANSWPMTAATFIVMYKKADKADDSAAALKFFDWAYKNGGKMADELDYVPMPASVIDLVEKTWAANIKDASGKALWK
ncbi:phosphate ABC transporter substrate-binding protein PstS [Solimonas variicoloris]|uniref:phosphate ABC transporter substrate-binding protein PstS n=1 Tax=Solimonas variicoloris TaxID=254408 RepID=UPI0003777F3E|nr:phosphate ABC transporter substrate-binding protein PstS [Solimonas variicoloris]